MVDRETQFVNVQSELESANDPYKWGDGGRAVGRFQWHPSAYASWGPKPIEFDNEEFTWDQAFEWALRNFYRAARERFAQVTDADIAMAWHLHGQLLFTGFDANYAARRAMIVKSLGYDNA